MRSTGHLPEFVAKMQQANLSPMLIDTFSNYYRQVLSGAKGLIFDQDIAPIDADEIAHYDQLDAYRQAGADRINQAVMIVLNGGLGTSMGLSGPKSLLEVKDGQSFLDIIVRRAKCKGVQLALMNSFSTDAPTRGRLAAITPDNLPLTFLQHKFPKIRQADFRPADWPQRPELEWNPPGHGDVYTALHTSGLLNRLLDQGIVYAFICNCDNLGASLDTALLGYFAENRLPFMMEVAQRAPADAKGGHLACDNNGRLLLREGAQCPANERQAFQDIERYRYFNTNSLWVDLRRLKQLIDETGGICLPMIVNPKTVDPRDKTSPPVFQIETAMGAAVSLFAGAKAVCVPRTRFYPVKKCNELLALQSDCFLLQDRCRLVRHPDCKNGQLPVIALDERFYQKIDDLQQRFPCGPPSLRHCRSLTVHGDVHFDADVVIRGSVTIRGQAGVPAKIERGRVIDADLTLMNGARQGR